MPHLSKPPIPAAHTLYTELLMNLSFSMLNAMDEEVFFTLTLQSIGEALTVGRVYVFEYNDKIWNNTHEWTAQGVSPQKENLQNISMDDMDAEHSMLHCILRGEVFSITNVDEIKDDITRTTLQRQGIRSVLAVPLYFEGAVRGMFGFDICEQPREWPADDIALIIAIGNLLSSAKWHFHMRRVLQAKEQQLHDIVDAFPDHIYVSDMESHRVLFANKSLTDTFGDVAASDTPCHKIFQNLDVPCDFCSNDNLRVGDPPFIWQHHNTVVNRDFKVIDTCIRWNEAPRARLSIAVDITDVLKSQREEMLAKESNSAKSMFLAHVSHEIRTPLNSIIGLNYLALKENASPVVEEYLRKIQHSSTALLNVINDILDFSKIESGKLVLESAPLSLSELLKNVHAMVEPQLRQKRLQWNMRLDSAIPSTLYGDPLRLSQILQNLVSNAVKFTEKGSVTINVSLEARTEDHILLQVQVRDTGIGIPKQLLPKLFSEYVVAGGSAGSRGGNAGLGLAIVKGLLDMMGGSISVHSTEGKGSTFALTIPLSLADAEQEKGAELVIDDATYPELQGLRVLLCEDNSINQAIITEMLLQQGCSVDVADDGIEAVAMVSYHSYDVVLMDIQMPHMDGFEATQRIRENPVLDKLPIIAMTANVMQGEHEKSLAAGMQDYITKPIDPVHLYHSLCRWCAPIRPDVVF